MVVFLRSLWLILAALPALARTQLIYWPARSRWVFRFALAAVTAWLSLAFGSVFTPLPSGWLDAVGAHGFTVPGSFVVLALLTFATASFGMGVLSAKVARTL